MWKEEGEDMQIIMTLKQWKIIEVVQLTSLLSQNRIIRETLNRMRRILISMMMKKTKTKLTLLLKLIIIISIKQENRYQLCKNKKSRNK